MGDEKLIEAVAKLEQAKKALREHIDTLDRGSPSAMFISGCLCEDCVIIAGIVDCLLQWRDERWPEGRRPRSAA